MLLATRCPFCETVFRLQPAQLALRRGLVRCGHCQQVFDATSGLYQHAEGSDFSTAVPVAAETAAALTSGAGMPQDAAAPAPIVLSAPETDAAGTPNFRAEAWNPWAPAPDAAVDENLLHDASTVQFNPAVVVPGAIPYVPQPPAVESSRLPDVVPSTAPFEGNPQPAAEHATLNPEPVVVHDTNAWHGAEPELTEASSSALLTQPALDGEPHFGPTSSEPFATALPQDSGDHFAVVRETRAAAPRRLGWRILGSLLALALLVLLLAQLAWWQRETVMVYWPQSQALYRQACAQLGCTVAAPRDIDGLQVEPSDLRQVDGPHRLELKMPLHNRFNVALAYPAIELTLLDAQNNVAVRRILWPQDYVKPGTPIAAGLPPRTTQTMIVHLDTGNAVATNFRVQIFYP
ncbi:zinc-ribbon and DUF3426 domain-containing protein [Paraburkholderia megapolitana]|uniref:MJ0042 family finger-like domain-containing protein n=1 Tax=Paraburkholderia megapolitana TaxID=420953 RepID=A0A1I3I4F4_9BURK|nr:zinc-ribbon and DUF3426 domain-containing protein [Paraburkholderia megapolitana]QDQ85380.1 DUF3426 domain-containing protein [Paraburkholderia megapolitana]SFI42878.1 MJ0042 family finger-like domain-containing protein [Paraburkholderia megapolitana]